MRTKIWLCSFLLLSIVAVRAQELSLVSEAHSAVAGRVAQLVAAGDYAGVAKVTEEIESEAKGVHDVAYFRSLLGVLDGLGLDTIGEKSYATGGPSRRSSGKSS